MKTEKTEEAERIVDLLFDDLNDRKGYEIDSVDEESKREWREKWIKLVTNEGGRETASALDEFDDPMEPRAAWVVVWSEDGDPDGYSVHRNETDLAQYVKEMSNEGTGQCVPFVAAVTSPVVFEMLEKWSSDLAAEYCKARRGGGPLDQVKSNRWGLRFYGPTPRYFPKPSQPAADWIDGMKAVRWGRWTWDASILTGIQKWGDSNCCRFILVSETEEGRRAEYELTLYIAPKPMRRATGLCDLAVKNRDSHMPKFDPWFDGYLAGRGLPARNS